MDKRVVFAVAGSGKTTMIINHLDITKRSLIITYTRNNYQNLREGILKKWGYIPENIKIFTYFSFVHSFCYKPFLSYTFKTKGLNYNPNLNRFAKGNKQYIDQYNRLYSNRITKFITNNGVISLIIERLEKYFDSMYIDEVQDFGGNDFNFLKNIIPSNINMLFVGDFYQHTFDTSRDGAVNKNLHKNLDSYLKEFEQLGVLVDTESLIKSYRCCPKVCDFVSENLLIPIESHNQEGTDILYINSKEEAHKIFNENSIVKLFYREHYKYNCYSRNWGDCKGEDKYENVCVVLNKTTDLLYRKNKLNKLATMSKNKLYVAITRTRRQLYFIPYNLIDEFKQ